MVSGFNLIELANDYKDLMREIEAKMFTFHAENRERAEKEIEEFEKNIQERKEEVPEEAPVVNVNPEKMDEEPSTTQIIEPFCRVVEVQIGSPAHESGFVVGDLVINFGSANIYNHNNLKAIAEVTKNHIDKVFPVVVARKGEKIELKVRPHTWNGPGILGCRFVENLS